MNDPKHLYKNPHDNDKYNTKDTNINTQVSKVPDVKIEISQTLHDSTETVGLKVQNINAETVNIHSYNKLDSFKSGYCSLLEWIFEKSGSCSLKKLHSPYASEVIQIIKQIKLLKGSNSTYDYTDIEIEALDAVFNFCHYFLNSNSKPRSKEFANFKRNDYYSYVKKLALSKKKIRITHIKLSLLVDNDDKKMSELVQQLEQDK